jgi:hypothetical protein
VVAGHIRVKRVVAHFGNCAEVRADLATFGSKLMECEKTDNRKNQYFKEFNKLKLF